MTFTNRLSGVVQLIAQDAFNNGWDGDGNDSFVPSLEWANLSYRATDDLTVRVGRIVLPFHMRGDSKKVGSQTTGCALPTKFMTRFCSAAATAPT